MSEYISLSDALRSLPGRPSPATAWRWRTRGVCGVRLQTWSIGGRIVTTEAAVQEFIDAVTAAKQGQVDQPALRSADTSAKLAEAGVL